VSGYGHMCTGLVFLPLSHVWLLTPTTYGSC
jgi:hypothetical protein